MKISLSAKLDKVGGPIQFRGQTMLNVSCLHNDAIKYPIHLAHQIRVVWEGREIWQSELIYFFNLYCQFRI